MFVVIHEEALSRIRDRADAGDAGWGGALTGRVVDNGDVVRITGIADAFDEDGAIGRWGRLDLDTEPSLSLLAQAGPGAVAIFVARDPESLWVGVRTEKGWTQTDYDVIRLHADFASRLDGLFDTAYLAGKTVAVIGLGTGGSVAAVELAKNGVGRFRLVDFDRLETHNVARHACGLRDIGRYKTRALADLLRDKHPAVQVETHEFNVLQDRDRLTQVIRGSDLVVAATDSEASKRAINEVCWSHGVPAVYGAAYDRAFGGDVLRVIPPDTPCYECFYKEIAELFDTAPKKTIDYSSADPTKVVAEPGLGLDVAFIALIQTKMALLTLLRGTRSTLEDFPKHYVMWGNRCEWIFEQPLQSLFLEVAVNPTCPVCRREAYLAQELGMTPDEARTQGQQVLAEVEALEAVAIEGIKSSKDKA